MQNSGRVERDPAMDLDKPNQPAHPEALGLYDWYLEQTEGANKFKIFYAKIHSRARDKGLGFVSNPDYKHLIIRELHEEYLSQFNASEL